MSDTVRRRWREHERSQPYDLARGREDLRAYAQGELAPPLLWSADTHLAACARCRARLAAVSDPVALDAGWERLDAELDAPRPGPVEWLLVRLGVADHTARLLAATPALRRSWLAAVAVPPGHDVVAADAVRADPPALFLAARAAAPARRGRAVLRPGARPDVRDGRGLTRCTASGC